MPTLVRPLYTYFASVLLVALCTPVQAEKPLFNLILKDPQNALGTRVQLFKNNLKAAVEDWDRAIPFKAALDIEVRLIKAGEGRLDGASRTSHLARMVGDREVFEEGASYKIRTGESALAGEPDVIIRINPEYLDKEIWMDPNPEKKSPVPNHKLDLVSILRHELGHALGFQSTRSLEKGTLPLKHMSAFDALIEAKDGRYFFIGDEAKKVFGGPVPITSTNLSQNHSHYGNSGDSERLVDGLMSGVTIRYGRRYEIAALDLAILKDLGLQVRNAVISIASDNSGILTKAQGLHDREKQLSGGGI